MSRVLNRSSKSQAQVVHALRKHEVLVRSQPTVKQYLDARDPQEGETCELDSLRFLSDTILVYPYTPASFNGRCTSRQLGMDYP